MENESGKKDDVSTLTKLGSNETNYEFDKPCVAMLQTFANTTPGRDYKIALTFPEFTSLCPKTKQPDFATINVEYVADKLCVESKSLKLYFFAYRNEGSFMETITNQILDHLVEACDPRWMKVTGAFNARGGLFINVTATYEKMMEKDSVASDGGRI